MNPLNYQTSGTAVAYECYADMLFRVAYSELLSKEDAEDTISEVFYKFIKKKPEFRDAEHEKAWFIRVTINQCHDLQRKRGLRSYTPLDEIADLPNLEKTEHYVLEDVLALPEKYKLVLILFYFEELKIEEIAAALKISKAAVKMRLNRGRESLKDRIRSFESEACKEQDCKQTGFRKQSLLRTFRPVIGLAACLVLIIGIAMPLANSQVGDDIFINGAKVGKNPICISQQGEDKVATARMMDVITVPITLNQEDAEMWVTSGNLQLFSDSGEIVEEAPSIQKEDGQSVYWILDGLEFDETVLTVKTKECKMTYQAYKEDTSGLYYITLKEKVNLQ